MFAANKDNLMPDFFLDTHPDTIVSSHNVKIDKSKTEAKPAAEKSDVDVEKIFTAISNSLNEELVKKVSLMVRKYRTKDNM